MPNFRGYWKIEKSVTFVLEGCCWKMSCDIFVLGREDDFSEFDVFLKFLHVQGVAWVVDEFIFGKMHLRFFLIARTFIGQWNGILNLQARDTKISENAVLNGAV